MVDKICRHCGTTILSGLQYCPGCLHAAPNQGDDASQPVAMTVAPGADGTWAERLHHAREDFATWISPGAAVVPLDRATPPIVADIPGGSTMAKSDSYVRVVCPKCLRAQRARLDLPPTIMVLCTSCLHQFPGSQATEFRKGCDITCLHCGTCTFCLHGSKISHCPNCKTHLRKAGDPEMVKVIAFFSFVAMVVVAMFGHSVATNTTPQFMLWFAVTSVFAFFGFLTLVALGF